MEVSPWRVDILHLRVPNPPIEHVGSSAVDPVT
jgi:hypothetical protein